jgi:hypothetical protein
VRLLGGTVDHFAIRIQHLDARFARLVYADPDPRMSLWVGNHQLRVLIFVGQCDALDALT